MIATGKIIVPIKLIIKQALNFFQYLYFIQKKLHAEIDDRLW